jgi:hypothetical protein
MPLISWRPGQLSGRPDPVSRQWIIRQQEYLISHHVSLAARHILLFIHYIFLDSAILAFGYYVPFLKRNHTSQLPVPRTSQPRTLISVSFYFQVSNHLLRSDRHLVPFNLGTLDQQGKYSVEKTSKTMSFARNRF